MDPADHDPVITSAAPALPFHLGQAVNPASASSASRLARMNSEYLRRPDRLGAAA
jgi:hypothetical protein